MHGVCAVSNVTTEVAPVGLRISRSQLHPLLGLPEGDSSTSLIATPLLLAVEDTP